jgi:hypothetical protein
MAVNTLKRGLSRETQVLLEYVRRARPANSRFYGSDPRPKPALLPATGGSIRG